MTKYPNYAWHTWHGGMRTPVGSGTFIDVQFRSGSKSYGIAAEFEWEHTGGPSDIVAFRMKPPSDPTPVETKPDPRITADVIEAAVSAGLKAKPCLEDFTRTILTEGLKQIETVDPDLTHDVDRMRRDLDSIMFWVSVNGTPEMQDWFARMFPDYAAFARTASQKVSNPESGADLKTEVQSDLVRGVDFRRVKVVIKGPQGSGKTRLSQALLGCFPSIQVYEIQDDVT